MSDANTNNTTGSQEPQMVQVPQAQLTEIMTKLADLETAKVNAEAKLEGLMQERQTAEPVGETPLRMKKTFEPAFRTARLKKVTLTLKGQDEPGEYIVTGWTNKGSYQRVSKDGITAEYVDYMDVILLDHDKDASGSPAAYQIKTLDLYNSPSVVCKIEKTDVRKDIQETGEVIPVTVYDPKHGSVITGETVDGWVEVPEVTLTLSIPGRAGTIDIDGRFVNIAG